jgi:glycosyltransferase involved in cell wall biosynthesis
MFNLILQPMNPLVSILLPAYNCEKYLQQTMDSLLTQSFQDFELLVINDGSTDGTEAIINSYADPRIKHIKNDGNKGLIYSLNHAIEIAKGKYLARMDADDICKTDRLAKQLQWMEQHPSTAVVGCHIQFINEHNNPTGEWPLDKQTSSAESIKKTMAWENCLAHPSVMMRSSILKNYQYASTQKHSEDYDLWLQLLADGHTIEKVPETLLLYRVHGQSVTGSIHRKKNSFFTNYHTKRKFLLGRIGKAKWRLFETKILFTLAYDFLMGIGKEIKKLLRN